MTAAARRALVTDGQERWGLAACRSLRRAGYRVSVAADRTPAVAHWSRHCAGRLVVPLPSADPDGFVTAIAAELERRPYSFLLISGDLSLLAVSRRRQLLDGLLGGPLGLPPHDVVEAAMDKASLSRLAALAGLDSPPTEVCVGVDDALRAAAEFGFPVAVKPRSSVFERDGRLRREGSRLASERETVERLVEFYGGRCLVQRLETGTVHSCSGVFAGGRMIALSLSRYLRTWPPEAGNAALSETVPITDELGAQVSALLGELGWQGIFELELLRRPDGSFSAIDLNPRLYGSVALAIRAAADLPAIWARWLAGDRSPLVCARPGVRYRWGEAELRRIVSDLRHGRVGDAAAVARPHRHVVHPHFRAADPGPLAGLVADLAARGRARLRSDALPASSEPAAESIIALER
jgi:predicted ATP-grasp superfamily ATP-dependent carboligase